MKPKHNDVCIVCYLIADPLGLRLDPPLRSSELLNLQAFSPSEPPNLLSLQTFVPSEPLILLTPSLWGGLPPPPPALESPP